jgi:hypothetical protein
MERKKMKKWKMRIEKWINWDKNKKYWENIILIAFLLQQWLLLLFYCNSSCMNVSQCYVMSTPSVLLVMFYIKGKGKVIPLQTRCGPEGG